VLNLYAVIQQEQSTRPPTVRNHFSPQPSRLYPRPSSRDRFTTNSITGGFEIHFGICIDKIYGFISLKKFVTFGYVVGVSFPRKFKLNIREF